jgi:hypothetical protein
MKTKLLLLSLFTSCIIFSQINGTKFEKYHLINKSNDTITVYGKKHTSVGLGFKIYDINGKKTENEVNPDLYDYLIFTNSNNQKITLKSLPIKREASLIFHDSTNGFMNILIENSEKDLEKGKIDFYIHEFSIGSPSSFGSNGFTGYTTNNVQRYYFKDLKGLHPIRNRSGYKKFRKLLGIELFKKMKKSNKEQGQFLFDYFTEYNKKIDNLDQE